MEKIRCICVMRELFEALSVLEAGLLEHHGVSLNEAMVLCSIGRETVTASVVVERTGLSASHASKVLRSAEKKELLVRELGEKDKRQMHFTLTQRGLDCLEGIKEKGIEVPKKLMPLFGELT